MIKNFDLNGWTLFSDRRNSKSYYSADKKWMVKFNTEVADQNIESFERDKAISEKALSIGIKTPKVGDIVSLPDGTCGLIYEYIEGKKSIARAISEDLDNIDYYIERFVKASKDFHSKICDTKNTVAWEERILKRIEMYPLLNDEQKIKVREFIDKIEKKENAILGDFHTGNFIITKDKEYVIDLGSLSYGNPIYDIAIFNWFTCIFPEAFAERIFHCKREHQIKMWESFVRQRFAYTSMEDINKFTEAIKKYALISIFGMYDFIDPTPDIPLFKKIYDDLFDKAFENKEILNI